ncbi:MAG: glycosyltransferase family 2 protein [Pseudomonadota bacterium]
MPLSEYRAEPLSIMAAWRAYRAVWHRRRLLVRALRKCLELKRVEVRARRVLADDILAFSCVRNEILRLPHFLDHHRRLGVRHFFMVDNGSEDGTREYLAKQPDVSLWTTKASYRMSRFGMDWLNYLLARYGSGHWCLTLDADELFAPPFLGARNLSVLTGWLDEKRRKSYGAMMLELYPDGPVGEGSFASGDDPLAALPNFDPEGYWAHVQPRWAALWVQGGPRARAFFEANPERAPTLNKTPFVRWHWRYAYVNSTHILLPRRLNDRWEDGHALILHTKFLPDAPERAAREKDRGEHFAISEKYAEYYDALADGPSLRHGGSTRFEGWEQAEELGLMSRGSWGG